MLSGTPPVLVTVTVCVELVEPTRTVPNARFDGATDTPAGVVPLTVSAMFCGVFGASSLIARTALLFPAACGVADSVIEHMSHCWIGAEVHVVETTEKWPGFAPPIVK